MKGSQLPSTTSSIMGTLPLLSFLALVFASSFYCSTADPQTDRTLFVAGQSECIDCAEKSVKNELAYQGLHVAIKCNSNGYYETKGTGKLDKNGDYKVQLPSELIGDDGNLKHECFAQLTSASNGPCPDNNGLNPSKLTLKFKENGVHSFSTVSKLPFSVTTCTSAFLWPYKHYYPPIYKKPLPPIPIYKKPCPPIPIYKPPVPIYKPPVPIYKPPVPIYKPPVPSYKPPVPIYKPPVPIYKPPVPIYKPPIVKPLPPPVPIYKKPYPPLPKFPPIYVKPLPPHPKFPPIYKKPLPPHPKFPPIYKKPLPPHPKYPPIYKKPFHHFPKYPPTYTKPLPPHT